VHALGFASQLGRADAGDKGGWDARTREALAIVRTHDPALPAGTPSGSRHAAVVQAESDGSWSGQLTVPGDADPDATWFVSALCFASPEAEGVLAVYELVEFDVTGPPTTPTTQPPTTPTTAPPPPEAPPAVPVVEEPIFTG
jgi:hypothetical protein